MTDNIFTFSHTNQALGDLSETVIRLDKALKNRQEQTKEANKAQSNLLTQKEQQLEGLRVASANVLENIDAILNSIDNILENNGSSHNNN